MPAYRRSFAPGGTFFLTLVTEGRAPILCSDLARPLLHTAVAETAATRPFHLLAMVLLPDHLHLLIQLPPGDANFSLRIAAIKSHFTRTYLAAGGPEQPRPPSRLRHRRRGVWQRWFWEHLIRDPDDLNAHLDYIHYNPVKHGHAPCPHAYPYSTFPRAVADHRYAHDWLCTCQGRHPRPPTFDSLPTASME